MKNLISLLLSNCYNCLSWKHNPFLLLVWLTVLLNLIQKGLVVDAVNLEVKTWDNSALDNVYKHTIVSSQKHIFVYKVKRKSSNNVEWLPFSNPSIFLWNGNRNSYPKIPSTLSISCNAEYSVYESDCPLMVTVTQGRSVVFWEVTGPPNGKMENSSASSTTSLKSSSQRSVCLSDDKEMTITVELSTCSQSLIEYTMSTHLRNDMRISLNQVMTAQITPTSPAVYYVPPLLSRSINQVSLWPLFVFIQLNSRTNSCMIMSVQKPMCPICDSVESIVNRDRQELSGRYQSVTLKTGMTIDTADFPDGFFLIFTLLPDDNLCSNQTSDKNNLSSLSSTNTSSRIKTINFTIQEVNMEHYQFAIFIPLGLFLLFISLIFGIHLHFHRIRCELTRFCNANGAISRSNTELSSPYVSTSVDSASSVHIAHQRAATMGSTDSVLRSRIQISELMNSQPERLMVQSKRYYMAGILVASFYSVPVFQLILSYHQRLRDTGNYDLCYFNYLCAYQLGMFHDFNHVYSNIGYVICGLVFSGMVYLRQITVNQISREEDVEESKLSTFTLSEIGTPPIKLNRTWLPRAPWDISKGVFVHHGLFYAMGFFLCMTGVMSAAYHICPNQKNFQFDTAFMYTIAALGVVTIYQFRHPTYVSASMTFLTLAIVAASTVVGLLWENSQFLLFFSVSHLTFLLIILTYIHYVGYIRVNGTTITEWRIMFGILRQKWIDDAKNCRLIGFQQDIWTAPGGDGSTIVLPGPCRIVFPIVVLGVNVATLAMIWITMRSTNFASQVLAVYVTNCSVYTIYYGVMKWLHYECRRKLWIQPAIYLAISIGLWMCALSFFGDVVTLWERSPAESRAQNAECTFLQFYDSHDVWHFTSAAALFSALMSLLTMDDDIIDKPKSEIPVF